MPENGIKLLRHQDILTFEEIRDVVKTGITLGINKVRITGGEPLVRKGIAELIKMLSELKGIQDLSMTTNGILLKDLAIPLANAGLNRVNISLDTVDPVRYKEITRNGGINSVFQGIKAAKDAGLEPIKINCVVFKSKNEPDALKVAQFASDNNLLVRYIHQMNLKTGEFSVVEGGKGGNCAICNRLRLTADGYIKPCLFADLKYNIRELGIKQAFHLAVSNKPECGSYNLSDEFYNLGG